MKSVVSIMDYDYPDTGVIVQLYMDNIPRTGEFLWLSKQLVPESFINSLVSRESPIVNSGRNNLHCRVISVADNITPCINQDEGVKEVSVSYICFIHCIGFI